MTGCGCHDPVVFGHGRRCKRNLGPARTGGAIARADWHVQAHAQEYDPTVPPDRSRPWHQRLAEVTPKFLRAYSELFASDPAGYQPPL